MILGVDGDGTRSDVVILAHWEPAAKQLNLVSLPRDTMVAIPCPSERTGCISPDKLGHAHAYGSVLGKGPELAGETVEQFLGVQVDHYLRVDFDGFARLIDALGGITLEVPPAMAAEIDLKPGRQRLNGKQALAFVRYRSDGNGDIGRIQRTHAFLLAMVERLREKGVPNNLPGLILQLEPHIRTDLKPGEMLSLLRQWPGSKEELQVRVVSLPGHPRMERGLWFWMADESEKARIVQEYITAVPKP